MKDELVVDVENEIRSFLKKYIPESKFTDDTNIFAEGFVNSLFAMDLIVFLEKNYGLRISNEDLRIDNFKSVSAISRLIKSKNQL